MTFPHFNRRLHLYLGLTLAPWFLMYGVSSIPFAHNQFFEARDRAKGLPLWTPRLERNYSIAIPAEGELRPVAARIVKDFGLKGAFGAYRQGPNQINVYVNTFRHVSQAKYFIAEQRIVVEDRRFRFDHFLTGMHARGGFEQDGVLNTAWGVMVDVACFGMLLWVLSGLYIWWSLPGLRNWGWAAFLGGAGSFALFMWNL
jgi:hypothetical protein